MKLPIFKENHWLPKVLSKGSPIEIGAITLGPVIFSRGTMSDVTRNHECIHWEQYKECLILGFLLIYVGHWVVNLFRFKFNGKDAYYNICFEVEAYDNDDDLAYLEKRKRFAWIRHLRN